MKKTDPRNTVVAMLVSEARQRSGMTKSDVTHRVNRFGVGWDSTVLGRIEKQQRVLQLAEAVILADALGVDLYDLVRVRDDDDERPPARDFISWLLRQAGRDDPVGDLARDVQNDRRPSRFVEELRDGLTWEPAIEALELAEAEWRSLTSSHEPRGCPVHAAQEAGS